MNAYKNINPRDMAGKTVDFDMITIKIASPEKILEWSFGEVTKPETINYRTQRSEKSGLFDEKIFGPSKDYECYCGKYRGIRYKGITCEKCGVDVTRSIVRRERMGHIELATPVSHVWFLRSIPSRMALVLGVNSSKLEKVIYFAGYIITKIDEVERNRIIRDLEIEYKTKLKSIKEDKTKDALKEAYLSTKKEIDVLQMGVIIDDNDYNKFDMKYGSMFDAEIGAEAIHKIFKELDLSAILLDLEEKYVKAGKGDKEKINKRISLIRSLVKSDTRPEWMFLTHIPILPPALRPMVPLEGGRHATSDVNDLYRRVINRNNRLKKLQAINAPHVILRNEKRILQEAVDALIDNSIRHRTGSYMANQSTRRPLKSLSDNLKGKQGIFRQNLLGKRVDYSARSVIVVGPSLALDQCGIPKNMALELFRPFIISELLKHEFAYNIRGANKLIDEGMPEVWGILEDVIKDKYVLLNRAPTLHRLGIQAFKPVLVEGLAIQVHPLVCTAFNADFDGDQMAVHVPLSAEAQAEAREIMASNKNILRPGNGRPVLSAKMLDVVLGCYWMTKLVTERKGEGKIFPSPNHAITAYDYGYVDFRAQVKVLATDSEKYAIFEGKIFETSVGRLLFNSVLPKDFPFVNKEIDVKLMQKIVDELIEKYGADRIPGILDKVKTFGFKYATHAGITWGIDDIQIPEEKNQIIAEARTRVNANIDQYNEGLLSGEERRRKSIEIWHNAKDSIEKIIPGTLDVNGSVYDMWKSGARGSLSQITAMAGMKGLIFNNKGETIEFPITTCSKEGHTPIEYFTTTHGSRKGLTDTALNTATAGYLTRKLFDVSQDIVVSEEDCGTKEGIVIRSENLSGIEIPLSKNLHGRFLAEDVKNEGGEVMFKRGHFITLTDAKEMEAVGISEAIVRSPMTCGTSKGLCRMCYGVDLGTNEPVELGEAVGTVAAQAIGEPGTQLTMRTFHAGGAASVGGDITTGLPRVIEIFERRIPKNAASISTTGGLVTEIKNTGRENVIVIIPNEEEVKKSTKKNQKESLEYLVSHRRTMFVKVGDTVKKGQVLTDGSADLKELYKYAGREAAQNYIIHEIGKIYELQGASISRKHIEVVIRQMFSRARVKNPGDTEFSNGVIVETSVLENVNANAKEAGLEPAKADYMITGITEVSLTRQSFLSAASFQHTTRILIDASIRGSKDHLRGLKENIIVGRLIPAGTGFAGSKKHQMIMDIQSAEREEYGE